jgi:HD-GYP domain-containing protein (c-di-GMP phosphodiesterase class II)
MSNGTAFPTLLERIKNVFSPRFIGDIEQLHALQTTNDQFTFAYDTTLAAWACALELRKHGTEGHIRRVTDQTVELARKLNIGADEIVHVRRGAVLHDIGEMRVPDAILLKNGPLSAAERAILRQHPNYAYEILSSIEHLRPALAIPYCHHEKWDGMGYPRGLKGEEIPLAARIFAVVDTWDALRTDRPYRRAWPDEKIRQYLNDQANGEFDPAVVAVFTEMISMQ